MEFLLSADFPGRNELQNQLDRVQVTGECDCGCGTIYLQNKSTASNVPDRVAVEAYGDGVDVLLFVRDGFLDCMEMVHHGDPPPEPLPKPEKLKLWDRPFAKP